MRKTLLFDLDGTLLNTLEDLRDSTNFALRTYGYPERSLEEVRRFVGNGLKMLLTRAVPQGSSEVEIERALACMKAHYCENYHNKTVPYPGIPELLQRLQQAGHIFLFHNLAEHNRKHQTCQLFLCLFPHYSKFPPIYYGTSLSVSYKANHSTCESTVHK